MASKSKEQHSPVKRRFSSPLGNQKYVTKGISPRFKTNLKDFRPSGPGKQGKQRGDLGPSHGKPWRKPHKAAPVRFHFGGNSGDPLNLNSLINRDPAVVTPQASPMSVHSESPIEVLEARDQTDPLNLKGIVPEPEKNTTHVTPKKRKKKKRAHNAQNDRENEMGQKEESGMSSQQGATCSEGKRKRKKNPVKTEELLEHTTTEDKSSSGVTDRSAAKSVETKDNSLKSPEEDFEPSPKKKAFMSLHTSAEIDNKDNKSVKMEDPSTAAKSETTLGKPQEIGKFHGSNKSKGPKGDQRQSNKKHKAKHKLFIYGNYNRYYGYRNPQCSQDVRLKCFNKDWFEGKDVLDLGCNVGHITLTIARDFNPHVVVGIDIDANLIKAAQNNLRYYVQSKVSVPGTSKKGLDFPMSFSVTSGPLAAPVVLDSEEKEEFPHNVVFKQENYVPSSSDQLSKQKRMYDVILCLSLTKWIHLNWGDDGLKLTFKRIFMNLRPGGRLILEPQPFSSYKKKKNLTEKIRSNFDGIKFRPEHFIDYLLSEAVGFASFEVLEIPQHKSSGFQRPLYLLTKASDI